MTILVRISLNFKARFIVEFRKHHFLFMSCVIISAFFIQRLQFGVDIILINMQFIFLPVTTINLDCYPIHVAALF